MAELKYAKNIITEYRTRPLPAGIGPNLVTVPAGAADLSGMHRTPMESNLLAGGASRLTRLLWLDSEVLKGAFYMDFVWYHQPADTGPGPHTHDFDEVLGFLGANPQNPRDLGGEMELWLDNEKYIIKNTCLVFVPRGLKHCPMIARKVTVPFMHFSAGNGSEYTKSPTK
jgi:hypothetical protein